MVENFRCEAIITILFHTFYPNLYMFLRTSLPIKGIAILALLFTFQSATAQWPSDRITFDTNRDQNGPRSLVIDGDNTLHAVWSKHLSGSNAVFYAQQRCEEPWSVPEVISFASFSSGPPTIALDPTNNDKVIAYGWAMGATSNINVVRGNMGSWTTMQVTNGTNIERTPTVSVDDQGKIHLAWTSEDTSGTWKVHYAHDRAGTWTEQRILLSNPGPFGGGAGPKIALDLNGAPSIAYREGDFGSYTIERLWMIHPDSTSWSGERISCSIMRISRLVSWMSLPPLLNECFARSRVNRALVST